ncbi:MAG: TonB family protein [Thermoanaerobaculia bacterium]
MSSEVPAIRPFGPYLLLRSTGADVLGTRYRAGTLGQPGLKPILHLQAFDGPAVDRGALLKSMEQVVDHLEGIVGPSVAEGAVLGAVDDLPFAGVDIPPGQTLDAISATRSGSGGLSAEQALFVTERVLAALVAARPLELVAGAPHGFLVPPFVLMSYDGEVRVFGFGLGPGLLPAARNPNARERLIPYIAPEILESGKPTPAGDVFSAAAILFAALTGQPPTPGKAETNVETVLLPAEGAPLPEPIRKLLRRGLASDPARRECEVEAYRGAVEALVYGGSAAASTFSLAFFMQQRFERTIRRESREREAEERLAASRPASASPRPAPALPSPSPAPTSPEIRPSPPAPRVRVPSTAAPRPKPSDVAAPVRTVTPATGKSAPSGFPMPFVVLGAVLVVAVAGAWLWTRRERASPAPVAVTVPTPAPTAVPTPVAPVVVGKEDPLFQAAVRARLDEELKKREKLRTAEQQRREKKKQADVDRAAEEARKAQEAENAARAARDRNDRDEALRLAREAQEARRRANEAAAAAKAAESAVKEGDLVEISQVDVEPAVVSTIRPDVPSLAKLRRVGGTVLLRVLVTETGQTGEVEILRDTSPRVGLGDSAKAAVERWTWTPATKDGKKVRTWTTVPIPFIVQ